MQSERSARRSSGEVSINGEAGNCRRRESTRKGRGASTSPQREQCGIGEEVNVSPISQSKVLAGNRRAREHELRAALEEKEAERIDIEEKYKSLEEEATGKTKKLKKVWHLFMQVCCLLKAFRQMHISHRRRVKCKTSKANINAK